MKISEEATSTDQIIMPLHYKGNTNVPDDVLFRDPPPKEECPICLLPMPFTKGVCGVVKTYMPCCGKSLCNGCIIGAEDEIRKGNMKAWCAFCRGRGRKELWKRIKKRMKLNEAEAFNYLGTQYSIGGLSLGVLRDTNKAIELFLRAAELGSIGAHYELSLMYMVGDEVEQDTEKAIKHWKLAAIGGHEQARHNLGNMEYNYNDNKDRAMKHFMIAARAGEDKSLKKVGEGYKAGHVTKDEYANTLRAHKCSRDEMKSVQRSKAWKDVNFS